MLDLSHCCDFEASLAVALDVAESRGFDVRSWAEYARQIEREMRSYDEMIAREGRLSRGAGKLERSIDLGVSELATAFKYLMSIVREAELARS